MKYWGKMIKKRLVHALYAALMAYLMINPGFGSAMMEPLSLPARTDEQIPDQVETRKSPENPAPRPVSGEPGTPALLAAADLQPYTPPGWDYPVVPSSATGTNTSGVLYTYKETYLDYAFINAGDQTTARFLTCVYLDDVSIECWDTSVPPEGEYYAWQDSMLMIQPQPGTHTLKMVVDTEDVIVESDETNNTWEHSFTWLGPTLPDLAPYTPPDWDGPIVPSSSAGMHQVDTLNPDLTYIDTAARNRGLNAQAAFTNCLYFDGTEIQCWNRLDGLLQDNSVLMEDWILPLSPTPGEHVLRFVVDVNNTVEEMDETNNAWESVFLWTDGCPSAWYSPPADGPEPEIKNDALSLPPVVQQRIDALSKIQASGGSAAPGRYDPSAFLQDTIAVGIVLPESAGSAENWTATEKNCVVAKIQKSMDWWKTRGGAAANLTFTYDLRLGVPTAYEPVDMMFGQENIWIGDTLTKMGFGSAGQDAFEQSYSYLDYLRSTYHTRWATVFFVADSSNDPDGKFKGSDYFAFAYLGGPYVVMTYDNAGWGIQNMNWVAAHEFGHIFWAADQYYAPGYGGCISTTQRYGYLGVENTNCDIENPASVPSIMRSNENALDPGAQGQVGWADLNENGINDVVDTAPEIKLSSNNIHPVLLPLTYTGTVVDHPWPHAVCGDYDICLSRDININTITVVMYQIDSGSWIDAAAADGAFDSDAEGFSFTVNSLSPGMHRVSVRAYNSRGGETILNTVLNVMNVKCQLRLPFLSR